MAYVPGAFAELLKSDKKVISFYDFDKDSYVVTIVDDPIEYEEPKLAKQFHITKEMVEDDLYKYLSKHVLNPFKFIEKPWVFIESVPEDPFDDPLTIDDPEAFGYVRV